MSFLKSLKSLVFPCAQISLTVKHKRLGLKLSHPKTENELYFPTEFRNTWDPLTNRQIELLSL